MSNSVCNHTSDWQIGLSLSSHPIFLITGTVWLQMESDSTWSCYYYKSLNLNWVGIVVHLHLNWKFSDLSSYEVTWHFSQGKISYYSLQKTISNCYQLRVNSRIFVFQNLIFSGVLKSLLVAKFHMPSRIPYFLQTLFIHT